MCPLHSMGGEAETSCQLVLTTLVLTSLERQFVYGALVPTSKQLL